MSIEDEEKNVGNGDRPEDGQDEPWSEPRAGHHGQSPEPPVRYDPDAIQPPYCNEASQPAAELESARRTVRIAQIAALVSLVIGGVILSTAAVVIALVGYRKVSVASRTRQGSNDESWRAMKRAAAVTVAMGIAALALNAIALAVIMPTVYEMIQSGDYGTLWNDAGTPSPDSGSSFWG